MSTRHHVEQCPRCELRFRNEAELRDHLMTDHDPTAAELADHLAESREQRRRARSRAARDVTHRRLIP